MFALSRVFYVASILPMSRTIGSKFERLIGKFVWSFSGKVLRVSLAELKLPYERGGLGLTCIHVMSKSLLLTQLLRLLKSDDYKSTCHISFWLGDILGDFDPTFDQGRHHTWVPDHFQTLACVLADARIAEVVTVHNWKSLTNRMVYCSNLSSLPIPKIELEAGVSLALVWKRLRYSSLSAYVKETLFLLNHNKLPVKERLHRIRLTNDPFCDRCDNSIICDLEHFFCVCNSVSETWTAVKLILTDLLNMDVSNSVLILLRFPKSSRDNEITWLVGNYVNKVWEIIYGDGKTHVSKDVMFGFLKYKYRCDQLGARAPLNIPTLGV